MTTAIFDNIVMAKRRVDRTSGRIEKAERDLRDAEIRLQVARQKYHEIVGPCPLRFRFKGPFREAFDQTDWLYYTLTFCVAAVIAFALMQMVGWIAMFVLGIAAVHVASHMRFKWARFTKWANTGRQ